MVIPQNTEFENHNPKNKPKRIHSRKGAKAAKKIKYFIEIETQTDRLKDKSLKTGLFPLRS
jgi:hypothetical protein